MAFEETVAVPVGKQNRFGTCTGTEIREGAHENPSTWK
jgi:hypothetical protein